MILLKKFMHLTCINMVMVGSAFAGSASWPSVGHDFQNTGVQPNENQINVDNVASLTQAWVFCAGKGNPVTSQPTVSKGILYCADYSGNVYAKDAKTGNTLWAQNFPTQFTTSPTIDEDKLYISTDTLYCLELKTGNLQWSQCLYKAGFYAHEYSSNCIIAENNVIVGVASHEPDLPAPYVMKHSGRVMAYDKGNGAPKWSLYLTSDQFSQNPEYGPGAGVWSNGAVDTKRGLLFVGTANSYAAPASPYTNSLIAINYKTGKIKWSYAFERNDVWTVKDPTKLKAYDHDVSTDPNLFTVKTNDGKFDVVGVGSKNGHYKIFNRDQKHPDLVMPMADVQLDQPSVFGALQGAPAVNEGVLYIASNGYLLPPNGTRDSLDYAGYAMNSEALSNLYENGSVKVWAFDIAKLLAHGDTVGNIPGDALIWSQETPGFVFTGPITYANGVLYQTSAVRGYARALDAQTGIEKWRAPFDTVGGGVTISHGMIYIPYGYPGTNFCGGIAAYKLP